jgi:hypothetical protein
MTTPQLDEHTKDCEAALCVADSFEAAFECLPLILKGHDSLTPTDAILVFGYALLHQMKRNHWDVADSLYDLLDSVDCLAAQIAAKDELTEHERQVVYRALEADYIANANPADIAAMDSALARFKRLAGLDS